MSSKDEKLIELIKPPVQAHLIGICRAQEEEQKQKSMVELRMLVKTMGLETASEHLQKRDTPDKTFYTGSGFLEEVVENMESGDVLIFDNDLNPSQIRNINKKHEIDVLDRTEVILEIFQQHAQTREAKIQVNLARYEYELPRLRNLWQHLDRERGTASTGGISRGSGEKQLELDRRYVRNKIRKAKLDLKKIASAKETQRQYRFAHFKKVCVVGYTNAGKSTLFNILTGSEVLVEDKLFATLESTSRSLNLGKGKDIIISDTVGFISQLPHHLVASFRATLQEARDADLLMHVIDISDEDFPAHIDEVKKVLTEIDCGEIPVMMIFNKIDQIDSGKLESIKEYFSDAVYISATEKLNLDFLLESVDKKMNIAHRCSLLIPHDEQKQISKLFKLGEILEKEYLTEGVKFEVNLNEEDLDQFEEWII